MLAHTGKRVQDGECHGTRVPDHLGNKLRSCAYSIGTSVRIKANTAEFAKSSVSVEAAAPSPGVPLETHGPLKQVVM